MLIGTTYTDSNGHTIEKYEINKDGAETKLEIDKTILDSENLNFNVKMDKNKDSEEVNIIMEGNK